MKILHLSDSPFTNTGFSTVSLEVLNRLNKLGYECHFMAHNYIGQDLPPNPSMLKDKTPFNFTLYGNGRQPYSQDLIMPRIRDLKPDFFGVLLDTFMVYPWFTQLDFAPALSYFYFPSDGGGGLPDGCEAILKKVNIPIAMSRFAQQQAKEVHGLTTNYIPHGVNTKNFFKLDDEKKIEIRKKWKLEGKFIIGTVARNQPRKMLDRMIRTAAQICKKYNDVMFFVHCDPFDPAAGYNIVKIIERFNLQNRFIFSGVKYHSGFSYEQMNEVYNLMDIFLLTTSGEGFGIPIIEAMSCEVPVVVTNYTTTQELVIDNGKCGEVVDLLGEVTGSWAVDRGIMDENDGTKKIEILYKDQGLRIKYGKMGRKKVEKLYGWDVVVAQWDSLFTHAKNGR